MTVYFHYIIEITFCKISVKQKLTVMLLGPLRFPALLPASVTPSTAIWGSLWLWSQVTTLQPEHFQSQPVYFASFNTHMPEG